MMRRKQGEGTATGRYARADYFCIAISRALISAGMA
jgi:hypothetical protein